MSVFDVEYIQCYPVSEKNLPSMALIDALMGWGSFLPSLRSQVRVLLTRGGGGVRAPSKWAAVSGNHARWFDLF